MANFFVLLLLEMQNGGLLVIDTNGAMASRASETLWAVYGVFFGEVLRGLAPGSRQLARFEMIADMLSID